MRRSLPPVLLVVLLGLLGLIELLGATAPVARGGDAPGPARPGWDLLPFRGDVVTLTTDGAVGRRYRDLDVVREYAALDRCASGAACAPVAWKTKIYVVRTVDATGPGPDGAPRRYRVAFDDAQVEAFRRVAAAFVDAVRVYSGGAARLDATIEVLDRPLATLDGEPGMVHPWMTAFSRHLGDALTADTADSFLVFWPAAAEVPHKNVWGLTGYPGPFGSGYSWVAWLGGPVDERAYTEVALHEWLHQVEFMRGALHGYPGLPALHDSERMGYRAGEHHPGWMLWYRDFMSTFMTPEMWRKLVPRRAPTRAVAPAADAPFVARWLVAGPFDNADDRGLERDPLGSAAVAPTVGDAAGAHRWAEATASPGGVLDFRAAMTPAEHGVAYASVYVRSPSRRRVTLWVGSDDGVVVWHDGVEVHRHHVHRGLVADQDDVALELEEGWNRLLFAVDQGGGGWSLCARLTHPDGRAVEGLELSASRPAGWAPAPRDPDAAPPPGGWRLASADWERVKDDPWRLLPELDEARLRVVTGDPGLRLVTGDHFTALRPGTWLGPGAAPDAADPRPPGAAAAPDAVLDFGRDSVAWLRHRRGGLERDLVLVRPDVVDLWLRRLDALDDPSVAVVGRVTADRRPLVAVETRLRWRRGEPPPATELALLRATDGRVAANLLLDDRGLARGEPLRGRVRLENLTDRAVEVAAVRVVGRVGGGTLWADAPPRVLEASAEVTLPFEAPSPAGVADGPWPVALEVDVAGSRVPLEDVDVVQVAAPVAIAWRDAVTGAPVRGVRAGRPFEVVGVVENRMRRDARVALSFEGSGVVADALGAVEVAAHGRTEVRARWTVKPPPDGAARAAVVASVARPEGVAAPARDAWAWTPSSWAVVGPFASPQDGGFAREHPPETTAFDPDARFDEAAGPVAWADLVPEGVAAGPRGVDFGALFPGTTWACAYAVADLESPDERDAVLRFGSDDSIVVWVDGVRVLSRDVFRPAAPDQDRVAVRLRRGRTQVRVRVGQGVGGWGFLLDVTDATGAPMRDVVVGPPPGVR